MTKRRPRTKKERESLWAAGNKVCAYCGLQLINKQGKPNTLMRQQKRKQVFGTEVFNTHREALMTTELLIRRLIPSATTRK
jgi:hypothetical protein